MGTLFHFDQLLPASDAEHLKNSDPTRQVEIFTSSGDHEIHLRVGRIGEQHQGNGYSVHLDKNGAKALLDGLTAAMRYVGYDR